MQDWKWGKKKYRYETLSLAPPLLSSPSVFRPSSLSIPSLFSVPLVPSQDPARKYGERCELPSGSGRIPADELFLMHSQLQMTSRHDVIAIFRHSNNEILQIRDVFLGLELLVLETYRYGVHQKTSGGMVWSRPRNVPAWHTVPYLPTSNPAQIWKFSACFSISASLKPSVCLTD